jgi:hypothetical protein
LNEDNKDFLLSSEQITGNLFYEGKELHNNACQPAETASLAWR